ncbi:MAG: YqgE/AlgH family protein, partial [Verrucomicrobiae bacterium]|nr:YqgE/AlgH family protein [Verrucomicrobiae bacterium]
MENLGNFHDNYSGTLLISHPRMLDPNFKRTVVLLSAHSKEDGALGVILNRPMQKCLGEIEDKFTFGPLAQVPIYQGGPVAQDQILLVAWTWSETDSVFKLFFGIDPERASELIEFSGATVRAFQGYSGWSGGQLEGEMLEDAWLLSPVRSKFEQGLDGDSLWKKFLLEQGPKYRLDAQAPED